MVQVEVELEEKQKLLKVDEGLAWNWIRMKKRILKKFGFYPSDHSKIQLYIRNIYLNQPKHLMTAMKSPTNFQFTIKFLLEKNRPIDILVVPTEKLKQKQAKRQQKDEVQFDENGSQISNEDLAILAPSYPPKYSGTGIVRCGFCHKSSRDREGLALCGGIYGPFSQNQYVHLLCAIWCSRVYLDEDGQLQGVQDQLRQGKKYKCNYCDKKGAAMCCHREGCNRTTHFHCAKHKDRCFFNWQTYQFWCHKCKHHVDLSTIQYMKENQQEEMMVPKKENQS